MVSKSAAKRTGHAPSPMAKPESVARRHRDHAKKAGQARPRGRPKNENPTTWHAIRLTVSEEMFNRLKVWRSAQKTSGSMNETVRYLVIRGLEEDGESS